MLLANQMLRLVAVASVARLATASDFEPGPPPFTVVDAVRSLKARFPQWRTEWCEACRTICPHLTVAATAAGDEQVREYLMAMGSYRKKECPWICNQGLQQLYRNFLGTSTLHLYAGRGLPDWHRLSIAEQLSALGSVSDVTIGKQCYERDRRRPSNGPIARPSRYANQQVTRRMLRGEWKFWIDPYFGLQQAHPDAALDGQRAVGGVQRESAQTAAQDGPMQSRAGPMSALCVKIWSLYYHGNMAQASHRCALGLTDLLPKRTMPFLRALAAYHPHQAPAGFARGDAEWLPAGIPLEP
ncbi:MAG: hypothetical protein M1826_004045 [Phylliscum demangeonii]|nr:MAG: hypothetical protein M1826_004045 [Phylliscum demangeonii]